MDTWTTQRKVAVAVLGALAFVSLAAVTMYMAGMLYLELNEVDSAHVRVISIIYYWRLNADNPHQRELLQDAILTSASRVLLALMVALAAKFMPWRRLRIAARFALGTEIARAGLFGLGTDPPIVIGSYMGRGLLLRGHHSVMLSAPPRSGKEAGMVIPNLLNWRDSVVVLDIDGRYFNLTAGFRAGLWPVFAFSPFDDRGRSHCWNPLAAVRDTDEYRQHDLMTIAEALFPCAGQESSDIYYRKAARAIFVRLGLMLFESAQTPRTLGEMLRHASHPQLLIVDLVRQLNEQGTPLSAECAGAFERELVSPRGVLSQVIATLRDALSIFGETSVDAATSGNDFRLEDVRRSQMSIYIRIPRSRLDSAKPLLNLFISQLVTLNTRLSPAQDPTLRHRCLLLNDEFTSMGRVEALVSKAAVLGDHNLNLLTIIEQMSELDAVYGKKAAHRFAANHTARIFFAPFLQCDFYAHSAAVDRCSQSTVSRGWVRSVSCHFSSFFARYRGGYLRPLLHPKEFKLLDNEQLILITQDGTPVLARKYHYDRDDSLKERVQEPPVVPRLDIQGHMVRVRRRAFYAAAPVDKPSPAAENLDSGLARDLGGLAGRIDESLERSEGTAPERQHAGAPAPMVDRDLGGVAHGGVITPLI